MAGKVACQNSAERGLADMDPPSHDLSVTDPSPTRFTLLRLSTDRRSSHIPPHIPPANHRGFMTDLQHIAPLVCQLDHRREGGPVAALETSLHGTAPKDRRGALQPCGH